VAIVYLDAAVLKF